MKDSLMEKVRKKIKQLHKELEFLENQYKIEIDKKFEDLEKIHFVTIS